MARRRAKKRGNGPSGRPAIAGAGNLSSRDPKSMVIRIGAGEVGPSVSQLATDVRRVMEPGTASRLKERRANHLKDYVTMAGPLGVSHLLLFSRSESGNTNLRIALTPRGPTLHFRIEKYSLTKDIQRAQRHPRGGGKEYNTPPLLVMNNISNPTEASPKVPKHLESLTTTVFQSLFPTINPQTTPLKTIRRVVLLNREQSTDEDGPFILNFRHYAITTRETGISKPLRRLKAAEKLLALKPGRKSGLPNLGKLEDIADFMIGGETGQGYVTDATSGSEIDTDAEVEVLGDTTRKITSRKSQSSVNTENGNHDDNDKVERRAVKLVELGPRMRLRLSKVEEGLCSGKVMWHEYIHKSKEEVQELEKRWEKKRTEKEARKKEQRANLQKKREQRQRTDGVAKDDEDGSEMELDDDDIDYSDDGVDFDNLGNVEEDDDMDDEGE